MSPLHAAALPSTVASGDAGPAADGDAGDVFEIGELDDLADILTSKGRNLTAINGSPAVQTTSKVKLAIS